MPVTSPIRTRLESLGARFAVREGAEVALSFGPTGEEVAAVRAACGIADWSFRGRLAVTGKDRVTFLHGQCTQDIAGAGEDGGGYGFVLDPRGRNAGDFRFLMQEDRILLEVLRPRLEEIRSWLERFVIAKDVHFEDQSDALALLFLAGPGSPAVLTRSGAGALPDGEGRWRACRIGGRETCVQADRTTGEEGFLVWVPSGDAGAVWDALLEAGGGELRPVGYEAVDVLRAEFGRPWFGRDLDETVLPVESGQLERGVSFEKGCYTGQEVVARQHFIGKPRKVLCGLFADGGEVQEGDPVRGGSRDLGRLTTVHRSPRLDRTIALAVLKGAEHPPGTRYRVVPGDGRPEVEVEVATLPFSG